MLFTTRLIKLSVVLLILFGCSTTTDVPLPVTSTSTEALELYNEGYYHFQQNEAVEAISLFEKALALDPELILANLYIPETDPNKRKMYRDRAIANKNNGSEAETILVDIYIANRDGRLMDRISLAKDLVNKYPSSSEAYVYLGFAYTSVRDFDNAINEYNKALSINSEQYRAWAGLAFHQVNVGNNILLPKEQQTKALAVKYTEGMVKARPNSPFSYQLRANVERQYSDFEKGKSFYQKMVDVAIEQGSSMRGSAHNVFAHNYLFSGDGNSARENYDIAISLAKRPIAVVNLSFYKLCSYLFQNNYGGALRVAQELDNTIDDLGFTEASLNQQRARLEFMRLISYSLNQEKEKAYESLMRRQNYAAQGMGLMEVDKVRQRDFDSFNYQMEAWYHILFGEYDQAKIPLDKLYQIVSKIDNPNALNNYNGLSGMVQLFTGNVSGSLSFFTENINPENYQYYSYFKALALKAAGKNQEAQEIFTYIANYNFNSWEAAMVRSLAKEQLNS